VDLDCPILNLKIPTGTRPGRSSIVVSEAIDQELQNLANPVSLVCRGGHLGGYDDGIQDVNFAWSDLYLSERLGCPDPTDPTTVQWIIEDNRRWVKDIECVGFMNKQRIANEFDELVEVGTNFGQFHRIGTFAYFVNTTRDPSGIKFSRYDAETFKPWTAFTGFEFMLTTFFDLNKNRITFPDGKPFKPVVIFKGDKEKLDNGFPLHNFSLNGKWSMVVARLAKLANVTFVPNKKGEWIVFKLDPKILPRSIGGYTGAGNPVNRFRRNSRSAKHRTIYRSRYDFRVDFVETVAGEAGAQSTSTVVDSGDIFPITAVNVVITPFDMPGPDGETVKRGTILPIEEFISILNLNPERHFPPTFLRIFGTLSLGFVKKFGVGQGMGFWLSFDHTKTGGSTPFGRAVAKTLYDFWRKLFQIPKELRDNLDKIKAKTSEVVDTRTGKQAPSRVYFDHTLIPTFWGAGQPGTMPEEGTGFLTVRPWAVGDADKKFDDADPCDFAELTVKDGNNGLFLVKTLPDLEGQFGRVLFTTFKKLPPNVVGIDGVSHFLETSEQDGSWRCSFQFSAELISSNIENYYVVEKPATEAPTDGQGPVKEERVRQVFAGYAWNDETSTATIDQQSGELKVSGFDLYNENRLKSIALGLRQTHYFYMQDWLIGEFRASGFDPDKDLPQSNYDVALQHSEGFFEAVYNAKAPKPKPLFEVISPEAAELLFKFDEDEL
ncbi:MAG: hypothetical protein P1V97_36170, partial [Planctomycetota bacterium]|nr:hypothetical protein [Planctomycetota bacterium]